MSTSWWKRYVRYEMYEKALRLQWKGPLAGWRQQKVKSFKFDENPPWTSQFKEQNRLGDRPNRKHEPLKQPIENQVIFKGDRVQILAGKDTGKQGIVSQLIKARNWCFVEGLNCKYEMNDRKLLSMPPTCVRVEKPLLVTKHVSLVDPGDFQPTEAEWRYDEKGEQVRVSKRSGRIIPMPTAANEVDDGVNPATYAESTEKDTTEAAVMRVSFEPKMKTFEQDIFDQMGIKEQRQKAPTYWY